MVANGVTPVVLDLALQIPVLDLAPTAIWLYDAVACRNLWGNRAALELFGLTPQAFKAHQPEVHRDNLHRFKADAWAAANAQLQEHVQRKGLDITVHVDHSSGDCPPGFLPLPPLCISVQAVCKPVKVTDAGAVERSAVLVQAQQVTMGRRTSLSLERGPRPADAARRASPSSTVTPATAAAAASSAGGACGCSCPSCGTCVCVDGRAANDKRMTEMCDNHAMFQFLFDEHGDLLAANKRAMDNMREHLGEGVKYTLKQYLSIGECDGRLSHDAMYDQAMSAIFVAHEPCWRMPQLRWSKRHPGKSRWVLYEMWPLDDPITGRPAVLVTEQNISQVKGVEEQYSKQMQRLEAQLEEALAQAKAERSDNWNHSPKIDIDTPAEKTLKLLERLLGGTAVTTEEAEELRDAILQASDLSQPVNLDEQLLSGSASMYELEVGASLLQLLSTRPMVKEGREDEAHHPVTPVRTAEPGAGPGSSGGSSTSSGGSAASNVSFSNAGVYGCAARGSRDGTAGEVGMGLDGLLCGNGPLPGHNANEGHIAVKELLCLVRSPTPEAEAVLARVEDWQFDSFRLEAVMGGRPLSLLAFYLIKRSDLLSKFDLDEHKLARFLIRAEEGYPDNPYHNRMHAADVLRSTHVLVTKGGLLASGYCDDTALLAAYLAAIMHDFEHRGVNNDFLVRTADPLAILYNDRSPMENHHLAAAFQLLSCDEFNFLKRLPHKARETLRKLIIDMVLATDMKQHFSIHSLFQAKLNHNISSQRVSGSMAGAINAAAAKGRQSNSLPRNTEDDPMRRAADEENKSLTLQVMLKVADLGHLATPATVHKQWVQCLEEEFFRQGDREKAAGLTVSPLMDRNKHGITKSQVGFFDIVALPLFQAFSHKFPDTEPLLAAVKENYSMWKDEVASAAATASSSGGSLNATAPAGTLSNGRSGSGMLSKAHSVGGMAPGRVNSTGGASS